MYIIKNLLSFIIDIYVFWIIINSFLIIFKLFFKIIDDITSNIYVLLLY